MKTMHFVIQQETIKANQEQEFIFIERMLVKLVKKMESLGGNELSETMQYLRHLLPIFHNQFFQHLERRKKEKHDIFEEIFQIRPEMRGSVKNLYKKYQEFQNSLCSMCNLVSKVVGLTSEQNTFLELKVKFKNFAAKYRQYKEAENSIFLDSYYLDIGGEA